MQISMKCSIAVHCLIFIHEAKGIAKVTSGLLSESTGSNPVVIRNILSALKKAGLSWECILNKREAFRQAFDGFDLETVCGYKEEKLEKLMQEPGIVRNKLKIRAAVNNARIFRAIQQEWGSFDRYLWHWTQGQVVYETGKVSSECSDAVSKDLKRRGMKFVGTVIIYSYLQAVGVINSHEETCFCRQIKRS